MTDTYMLAGAAPYDTWLAGLDSGAKRNEVKRADLDVLSKLGKQGWNGVLNPRHLRGVRLVVGTISWMSWLAERHKK
jgi:hypothetical protein